MTTENSTTEATPLQGLAAYLRCEAGGVFSGHPSHATLLQWATEVEAAQSRASAQGGERVGDATAELFARVGAAIATQDNRATDAPIFIVQQKRSYVTEEGYNDSRYEWRETESGDYSGPDDEELARLDKFYSNEGHEPKGWKRFAIMDVWEFVTACFTEQGCKDYLAINGHNLKGPRIYAEGSYRNEEFRAIRKALIEFATPPAGGGKEALSDAERLTQDEIEEILLALGDDHNGSDFEPECPSCTAYQKIAAIRATQKGQP